MERTALWRMLSWVMGINACKAALNTAYSPMPAGPIHKAMSLERKSPQKISKPCTPEKSPITLKMRADTVLELRRRLRVCLSVPIAAD